MKLNVIFKEMQYLVSGDETIGIKLEHGFYNEKFVTGSDILGVYHVIPMDNVAYLTMPNGQPSILREEQKKEAAPLKAKKPRAKDVRPKADQPTDWIDAATGERASYTKTPLGKAKK